MKPEQTAVEWLVVNLNQEIDFIPLDKWDMIRDLVQQAKAMEREQHGHTWDEALIQVDRRGGAILRALVDFDNYWPNKLDQKV